MAALVNSGSRRELAPSPVQTNKVGCMSTLFHRLFHYPSNTRKRITNTSNECRSQQETMTTTNCHPPLKHKTKINMSRPASSLPKTKQPHSAMVGGQARIIRLPGNIIDVQSSELTTKSHRQQMMMNSDSSRPPEFRQTLASLTPDQGQQRRHFHLQSHLPVVAKLMGLSYDIRPTPVPTKMIFEKETVAEQKRRKLVAALEKCDKDLQDLKKMIEGMKKPADRNVMARKRPKLRQLTHYRNENEDDQQEDATGRESVKYSLAGGQHPDLISRFDMSMQVDEMKQFDRSDRCDQQPSPVSVLDPSSHDHIFISSPSVSAVKSGIGGAEDKEDMNRHSWVQKEMMNSSLSLSLMEAERPRIRMGDVRYVAKGSVRLPAGMMIGRCGGAYWRRRWKVSEAMRETVNEVVGSQYGCQRGRVGTVVETHIFGDLLADLVKDLLFIYHSSPTHLPLNPSSAHSKLPFQLCKRRLSF